MTSKKAVLGVVLVFVVYCGIVSRGVSGENGECHGDSCGKRMELSSRINDNSTASSHSNSSNNDRNDIQEITFHTPSPPIQPQALNMMVEGDDHQTESSFQPTPVPVTSTAIKETTNSSLSTTSTQKSTTENSRGRALNFTVEEKPIGNNLTNRNSKKNNGFDLSDVSIEDDDEDIPSDVMIVPKILSGKGGDILTESEHEQKKNHVHGNDSFALGICEQGGLTYENGEKLEHGCDTICTCNHGKMDCVDRCTGPFFKKGKRLMDPLCSAKDADDPCCSVLVCAADTETEPTEMCTYENKTYNRGDIFNKSCSETCTCNAGGQLNCKSRCPPTKKTSDRCVELPDPNDHCCKQVLCDVTLDDHQDAEKEDNLIKMRYKLISATQMNDSVIVLETDPKFEEKEIGAENLPVAEISNDKLNWIYYQTLPKGLVYVKEKYKYLRLEGSQDIVEIKQGSKTNVSEEDKVISHSDSSDTCEYRGKKFPDGESYNDDCEHICVCKNGEMKCLKLECPTYFGVDVMDPNCIEWETIPPNFKVSPPKCCPDKIKCKNNGSCTHSGMTFKNWEKIPSNLTGCEKTCYCEMGHIECQQNCPPVPALPPSNLPCAPHEVVLQAAPHDECCKSWECNTDNTPKLSTVTKPDKKGHTNQISTNDKKLLGPFMPIDSDDTDNSQKLFGPLTVYENDFNDNLTPNQGSHPKPHVYIAENPFYKTRSTKNETKNHNKSKANGPPTNPLNKNPFISRHSIPTKPYFFKQISRNHSIASLTPNNAQNMNIISPLVPLQNNHSEPHEIPNIINNNFPNYVNNPAYSEGNVPQIISPLSPVPIHHEHLNNYVQNPEDITQDDSKIHHSQNSAAQAHEIQLHGHGSPEDLLEFIRNHPEISNLPSGSVLEIRNPNNYIHKTYKPPSNPNSPVLLNPYQMPQRQPLSPPHASYVVPEEYLAQILGHIEGHRPLQDQIVSDSSKGHILTTTGHDKANLNETGFNNHFPDDFDNSFHQPREDIEVQTLEAIDPHTVKLAFVVPSIYVGLHGRVEVRYTHTKSSDIDSWESQVFAPPNDLIETPSLEFDLQNLLADKEYQIKISITLRDLHNAPSSRIYKIRTPKEVELTTLPPIIPIEPDLKISDINSSWVTVVWRKFTEYELQFIDGLQLRYREVDGKIYLATPLIHRAVTSYTVEHLKPNFKYEIGIFFIPFPNQKTELNAEHMLHFTTANELDTYGFSVTLEITQIKATNVEISWSGVPYPEDKYVNIYRAIYQSDSGKEDQSTFKIAKRDSPTKTIITDLKPGTRYRLWLEVYLTNGKIKTSNVQDFITKPRAGPVLGSDHDKISRAEMVEATRGDYYGPLVIVAILASIAILSTLILLLILVRRHNQNKAAITPPNSTRLSNGAYDNPTYKVEIQQETMGL